MDLPISFSIPSLELVQSPCLQAMEENYIMYNMHMLSSDMASSSPPFSTYTYICVQNQLVNFSSWNMKKHFFRNWLLAQQVTSPEEM